MAGNHKINSIIYTQIKKSVVFDFLFFRIFRFFFTLELGDPPSDLAKSAPGEASGTPWTLRTAFGHVLDVL